MTSHHEHPEFDDSAVCAQTDPDLWFPEKGERSTTAIRLCAGCPVEGECLEAAIARDERFGVWGGKTTPERDRLVAERRATA